MSEPHEKNWDDFYFASRDDLKLYARLYGWQNTDSPVVVCLPGLTRNARDFHELASELASHPKRPFRVICMDYRGRGLSQFDKNWNNYNPIMEAEDVLAGLTALNIGHCHVIGTSRGGLIAMILTAMRPGTLQSVVLNDVGPEIDGKGLVRIRAYVERTKPPANRQEAIANLQSYSSAHFPNLKADDWEKQVDLIYEERDGKLVPRYDPKLANTLKSINLDAPLPSMWPQFGGLGNNPVLLIRGANTDLLSRETVEKMQDMHPGMRVIDVVDQGHAPDLGTAKLPSSIHSFLCG